MRSMIGAEDVPGFINLTVLGRDDKPIRVITVAIVDISAIVDGISADTAIVKLRDHCEYTVAGSRSMIVKKMRASVKGELRK